MSFANVRGGVLVGFLGAILAGCSCFELQAVRDEQSPMFTYANRGDFAEPSKMAFPMGMALQPDALKKLKSGMSKDQIRDVLGDRQYNEDDFATWHRWDYLFQLPDKNGEMRRCQYQVRFFGGHAYGGYWADRRCRDMAAQYADASGLGVVDAAPCKPVDLAAPLPEKVDLSADTLFPFDKGSFDDISTDGRKQLSDLIAFFKARISAINRLVITGYTDRLGGDEHNDRLSSERARAISDYMIAEGIPAAKITALGKGAADPIVVCNNDDQIDLIRCLQKNRRVEIRIEQK
ncbi:OmpA family protein [Burkholderia ubonensis]|uniref:OmpA family protein n=1 Tax=Burkholderia ubonensis TaxID=101571 RepID=UPI00358E48FA